MAKTPAEMEATVLKNIPQKTGIGLNEWMVMIDAEGPKEPKEIKKWLKENKGLGTGQANILGAFYVNGGKPTYGDQQALLEAQYTEEKAALRPLYDKLEKEIKKLDKNIRFEPCQTYVSIIAKNQFAIAQPAKNELRLGLALGSDVPENKLLKKNKTIGSDKISHYFSIKTKNDIQYAKGFIKVAYLRYKTNKKSV